MTSKESNQSVRSFPAFNNQQAELIMKRIIQERRPIIELLTKVDDRNAGPNLDGGLQNAVVYLYKLVAEILEGK